MYVQTQIIHRMNEGKHCGLKGIHPSYENCQPQEILSPLLNLRAHCLGLAEHFCVWCWSLFPSLKFH